jgi:ubiquinone/menaquinone biosynthesis C-methylase UbiE
MTKLGSDRDARSPALVSRVNELYHDLQASSFNQLHVLRHRVERKFWLRHVVPRLSEGNAKFGVDLCTGTGFVPLALLGSLKSDVRMLCVDLSQGTLARAKAVLQDFEDRATFHAGSAVSLPLSDNAADWVSMNAGLHHISDPISVLREVGRVLKPGGLFCLGHEPNADFFSSKFLFGLERVIWHLFWYLSPVRNFKRLRRKLGWKDEQYEAHEHLGEINNVLLRESLIESPLSLAELRNLVDVHTHGDDDDKHKTGLHVDELIRNAFPTYTVEVVIYGDYGGEMLRKHLWLRGLFDGLMRILFPGKGRLFSWILRKSTSQGGSSEA